MGDDDCQAMILNIELVCYEGACKHELWGKKWRGFDVDMFGEVSSITSQWGAGYVQDDIGWGQG